MEGEWRCGDKYAWKRRLTTYRNRSERDKAGVVGQVGLWYETKKVANISATVAVVPVWAKSINIESKPWLGHEVYKWRRNSTGTDRRLKQNKNNIEGSWINVTTMYFFHDTTAQLAHSQQKWELQSDLRKPVTLSSSVYCRTLGHPKQPITPEWQSPGYECSNE